MPPMRRIEITTAGLIVLVFIGCGGPEPAAVLDVAPGSATCFTATQRVLDVRPLPGTEGFWAATEGGLLRFAADGSLTRKYTRRDGLVAHGVRRLARASDGALWIATDDGVSRWNGRRFDNYTSEQGLNDDRCHAVEIDSRGTVYVGTERGVARFDGRRFAPFHDTHEFSRRATYDIHAAADGTVWFAKENALTRWLGGSDWEVFQRDPLLPGPRARLVSNSVRAVITDARDRPWIGTHEGLGTLEGRGWDHIVFDERLYAGRGPLDNRIATLAVDTADHVWIAHGESRDFDGGLGAARFQRDDWQYFTVADGLPDNRVLRIRAGEAGTVWLATARGVARRRDGSFESFVEAGELPDNHVTGLAWLGGGLVAVQTPGGTAWFRDGRPCEAPPAAGRLPVRPPTRATDRNGRPAVGTRDVQGRLWVGTRHAGLWRRDAIGWTEVRLGGRSLPPYISALLFEEDETLWVGTVTEGAIRLDLGAHEASVPAPGGL
jgi:ligand-binding sensor domain-containing protein